MKYVVMPSTIHGDVHEIPKARVAIVAVDDDLDRREALRDARAELHRVIYFGDEKWWGFSFGSSVEQGDDDYYVPVDELGDELDGTADELSGEHGTEFCHPTRDDKIFDDLEEAKTFAVSIGDRDPFVIEG